MKNLFKALFCLTVLCSLPACKYFSKESTKPAEVEAVVVETMPEMNESSETAKEVA